MPWYAAYVKLPQAIAFRADVKESRAGARGQRRRLRRRNRGISTYLRSLGSRGGDGG